MNFCSLPFLVQLAVTFVAYWRLGTRNQNRLLVVASAVFYAWWDWRFLGLMYLSAGMDFACGRFLASESRTARERKIALVLSLCGNLGLLGFFKYANFFIESATTALTSLGFAAHASTLNIVLPVGISFYTFQTMSYSIDVYRRQVEPTRDFLQFITFVTFFPQLVAGPIERAGHLLGQFAAERHFNLVAAKDGLRQILWGFVKKLVVADVIAGYTMELVPSMDYGGEWVAVKTIVFAFQIYYDFSGYSDIAIGTARLFGIRLTQNFANPYFSRNFTEFWERWHISLSTWFRDYVYIPLGGNRVSNGRRQWNIIATFAISGLWHGANWTFVVWGILHAYFVLGFGRARGATRESSPATLRDAPRILAVFAMTCFAWIFFWSPSIGAAVDNIARLFAGTDPVETFHLLAPYLLVIVPVLAAEWFQRTKAHPLEIESLPVWGRWLIYSVCLWAIFIIGNLDAPGDFIYFQF